MTSCWDLGILAAGPLGGLVAANLGYRPAFAVAAALALVAGALTGALSPTDSGRRTRWRQRSLR